MIEHVAEIRRRESYEKIWMLTAACQPHTSEQGRREAIERAQDLAGPAAERSKSAFEQVDDEARVQMIGQAYSLHGDRWAQSKSGRKQLEWLRRRGVSIEEAIRRHREWLDPLVEKWQAELAAKRGA